MGKNRTVLPKCYALQSRSDCPTSHYCREQAKIRLPLTRRGSCSSALTCAALAAAVACCKYLVSLGRAERNRTPEAVRCCIAALTGVRCTKMRHSAPSKYTDNVLLTTCQNRRLQHLRTCCIWRRSVVYLKNRVVIVRGILLNCRTFLLTSGKRQLNQDE